LADSVDDLLRALEGFIELPPSEHARLDLHRAQRKGVPEVVMAAGKRPETVVQIVHAFLEVNGRALVSRVGSDHLKYLQDEFIDFEIQFFESSRVVVVRRQGQEVPNTGGRIGIITAGTSDIPVAEEARIVAEEMGCQVTMAYDVGVAGIHRLFQPLREMLRARVDVIVVAAGMDGALPSVVAGLVDVPVIGLPTCIGYGIGGKGVAALLSMLQTCSPGLVVVNIDNGVGAGASAGIIANQMAAARDSAVSGHKNTVVDTP
jgi:NCAIR mutase (PurE)-related protein